MLLTALAEEVQAQSFLKKLGNEVGKTIKKEVIVRLTVSRADEAGPDTIGLHAITAVSFWWESICLTMKAAKRAGLVILDGVSPFAA